MEEGRVLVCAGEEGDTGTRGMGEGGQEVAARKTPDAAAAVANVYVDPSDLPIAAFFSFAPGAKDWVLFANYYFRADGTLAKKNELLNTTHGRVSMSRETLFGCQGEELKATQEFVDLSTKRKRKRPGDDFVDEPSRVFKRVEELPFYGALRQAR